ncbi:MAG: Mut7-C RNAse domain-containing protein [Thermodesulfovibrionales bacterium]|nr:Mut7-C RNAse domain-containing protein [Thermodesulfovibrionales bacterium]
MSSIRFIADAMLGKLSKWLRILGFDTLYFKALNDNELVKIAKQQQRILLTRDTLLVKIKRIDGYILINSNDTFEQLREVLLWIKDSDAIATGHPRCVECNGELDIADSELIRDDVPEHVFLNSKSFFRCRDCGKVYWEGSHKKLIDTKLQEMLKEIDIHWKD